MKLRVFLPDSDRLDEGARVDWMLFDARAALLRRDTGTLAEMPRAGEVEAVLPAARVLFARLKLPRVNAATIRELLPYAVEDRLLADPSQIHAVPGKTNEQGETVVAVVDRTWLEAMLRVLAQAGLRPRRAWCESALLAGGRDDWHVVLGAAHGFLVDDDGAAAGFEGGAQPDLPLTVRVALDEAASRGARPDGLRVHTRGGAPLPDLARWSEQAGIPFRAGSTWEDVACGGPEHGALELLSGDLAARLAPARASAIPRAALALAAILGVLHLGFTAIDAWRLTRQHAALLAQQEATFRAAFPEAKVVVDPPLQMTRNLAELKRSRGLAADDDFLVQATRAARDKSPGTAKSLAYTDGRLEVKP